MRLQRTILVIAMQTRIPITVTAITIPISKSGPSPQNRVSNITQPDIINGWCKIYISKLYLYILLNVFSNGQRIEH